MNSLKLILSDRAYFSPAWVFASLNIMTGTWILYLPFVKSNLELNDSEIGVALFFLALGLLISIPIIPFVNHKIGVGQSTKWGVVLYSLAFNLPLLAPTYSALCICLLLVGIFSGFTDISMNALVSTIEKNKKTNFMSASHGFFSLGGFIGAGLGSLFMSVFSNSVWHMFFISIVIICNNLILSTNYVAIKEHRNPEIVEKRGIKNIRPLIGLAIVAFIIMFNEGAVEHWSSLFLFDVVEVPENIAGFGFIAFSLFMTCGRFLGDEISKRIGSVKIILGGCIIAFFGYLFVISSDLILTVTGFGITGFGLSVVIPEIYRMAGKTKDVSASVGISIVSGIGFAGFLVGPVILGFISDWANLTWSFSFLSILVLVAIFLSFFNLKSMYSFQRN